MYFANPSTQAIRDEIRINDRLGFICTPTATHRNQRVQGSLWCADNGCFGEFFNEKRWWSWLESWSKEVDTCVFATAPDVVGDHDATVQRSGAWLQRIRALGYPAAFVAQDGATVDGVPWDEFDVLFVGGSTNWKLSGTARDLVGHALALGKYVHFGRCNSFKRFRYAEHIGCDSADGTFLVFGPDKNLKRMLRWISDSNAQPALFGGKQ